MPAGLRRQEPVGASSVQGQEPIIGVRRALEDPDRLLGLGISTELSAGLRVKPLELDIAWIPSGRGAQERLGVGRAAGVEERPAPSARQAGIVGGDQGQLVVEGGGPFGIARDVEGDGQGRKVPGYPRRLRYQIGRHSPG